jgi:hypothetical protein
MHGAKVKIANAQCLFITYILLCFSYMFSVTFTIFRENLGTLYFKPHAVSCVRTCGFKKKATTQRQP